MATLYEACVILNFEHRDLEYACLCICILCVVFSCDIRCLVMCQTTVKWILYNVWGFIAPELILKRNGPEGLIR
jgi:hypothetical protein